MILAKAKECGYRPDLLARGLVKGQTFYIGVVVLDVNNRYFAQMLSAIEMEARGFHLSCTAALPFPFCHRFPETFQTLLVHMGIFFSIPL